MKPIFIKYQSIEQFRNTVRHVQKSSKYITNPETGLAEYDRNQVPPTIEFTGTVKLHGTNAGISAFIGGDDFWVQSRNRVISVDSDNAGFAFFCESNKEYIKDVHTAAFREVFNQHGRELIKNDYVIPAVITIFGEWCGGNIQKGVGLTELPKMFVIFGIKVTEIMDGEMVKEHWVDLTNFVLPPRSSDCAAEVHMITDFPTYKMVIDFSNPSEVQNDLIELTTAVEDECPVAKKFGVVGGTGEGIVWSGKWRNGHYRFKVKGKKHSVSKVKKLASVDPEKISNIQKFVEYAVTDNRCQQGFDELFPNPDNAHINKTGEFIKWVRNDVAKEEVDVIAANNLEFKDVIGAVCKAAAVWFHSQLDILALVERTK